MTIGGGRGVGIGVGASGRGFGDGGGAPAAAREPAVLKPTAVLQQPLQSAARLAFGPEGKSLLVVGHSADRAAATDVLIRLDLVGKTAAEPIALGGPAGAVVAAPDASRVAICGWFDNPKLPVRLFDPATGKETRQLPGQGDPINRNLAWSPDGRRVVTFGSRTRLQVTDVETGKFALDVPVNPYTHGGSLQGLGFSPDGKRLLVAIYLTSDPKNSGFVAVREASTGREIKRTAIPKGSDDPFRATHVGGFVWLDDRTILGAVGAGAVTTIDADAGGITGQFEPKADVALPFDVMALSPDRTLLATAGDKEPDVWLWDVKAKRLIARLPGHQLGADAVAFAPDSAHLATGDGKAAVRLWDVPGR